MNVERGTPVWVDDHMIRALNNFPPKPPILDSNLL